MKKLIVFFLCFVALVLHSQDLKTLEKNWKSAVKGGNDQEVIRTSESLSENYRSEMKVHFKNLMAEYEIAPGDFTTFYTEGIYIPDYYYSMCPAHRSWVMHYEDMADYFEAKDNYEKAIEYLFRQLNLLKYSTETSMEYGGKDYSLAFAAVNRLYFYLIYTGRTAMAASVLYNCDILQEYPFYEGIFHIKTGNYSEGIGYLMDGISNEKMMGRQNYILYEAAMEILYANWEQDPWMVAEFIDYTLRFSRDTRYRPLVTDYAKVLLFLADFETAADIFGDNETKVAYNAKEIKSWKQPERIALNLLAGYKKNNRYFLDIGMYPHNLLMILYSSRGMNEPEKYRRICDEYFNELQTNEERFYLAQEGFFDDEKNQDFWLAEAEKYYEQISAKENGVLREARVTLLELYTEAGKTGKLGSLLRKVIDDRRKYDQDLSPVDKFNTDLAIGNACLATDRGNEAKEHFDRARDFFQALITIRHNKFDPVEYAGLGIQFSDEYKQQLANILNYFIPEGESAFLSRDSVYKPESVFPLNETKGIDVPITRAMISPYFYNYCGQQLFLPSDEWIVSSLFDLTSFYNDTGEEWKMEGILRYLEKNALKNLGTASRLRFNNIMMGYYYEKQEFGKAYRLFTENKDFLDHGFNADSKLHAQHLAYAHRIFSLTGDHESMITAARKSAELYKSGSGENSQNYYRSLLNLSRAYIEAGMTDEAAVTLKEAENIFTGNDFPVAEETGLLKLKGLYFLKKDQADQALAEFRRMALLSGSSGISGNQSFIVALEGIADAHILRDEYSSAATIIDSLLDRQKEWVNRNFFVLTENQRSIALNDINIYLDKLGYLVSEFFTENSEYVTSLFEHKAYFSGWVLNARLWLKEAIESSGDKNLQAQWNSFLKMRETSSENSESMLEDKERDLFITIGMNSNQVKKENAFERLRSRLNRAAYVGIQTAKLDENRRSYYAFLVTPEMNAPSLIRINNEKEVMKGFESYRQQSGSLRSDFHDEDSYNLLWKNIDVRLKNTEQICYQPSGIYNLINPSSIYNPGKKEFIAEKNKITWINNIEDVNKYYRTSPRGWFYFFGNPVFYADDDSVSIQTIDSLPGTGKEIEMISFFLDSIGNSRGMKSLNKIYTGKDATESSIKNIRYAGIVHIATHGFFSGKSIPENKELAVEDVRFRSSPDDLKFSDDPLVHSGLLLANSGTSLARNSSFMDNDGILTAYDVMNLDLKNTELVVLSACKSGLGYIRNGDGVVGLQSAFRIAGAKKLIMTLWEVDDQVTAEFMYVFYRNLVPYYTIGNVNDAFVKAQKSIRVKYPHPYYWGAFVLLNF